MRTSPARHSAVAGVATATASRTPALSVVVGAIAAGKIIDLAMLEVPVATPPPIVLFHSSDTVAAWTR